MIGKNAIIIGQQILNDAIDKNFNIYPNIDQKYGPYDSLEDALKQLTINIRTIGLTFGVCKNSILTEYWFQGGIEDKDVIKKDKSIIIE